MAQKKAPAKTRPTVNVGFIGLGKMGMPLARRLLDAGYALTVHDVNPAVVRPLVALGASSARDPRQVASRAEIVCTCLPALKVVQEVVLGEQGVVRGAKVKYLVDFSTTGPQFARQLSADLAKAGIRMLDSPVSGGIVRAAQGKLALIVSGERQTFKAVAPVLAPLGKAHYVSSKPGAAQIMKLINNLLSAIGTAAAYEAFVMGVKAGLDPDIMVDVINDSTGRNNATEHKIPRSVLPRTFDYGSNMEITYKDISLCMAEAEKLGVTMLLGNMARQLWSYGVHHGGAKKDSSTLINCFEDWAGVKVIGKAARKRGVKR